MVTFFVEKKIDCFQNHIVIIMAHCDVIWTLVVCDHSFCHNRAAPPSLHETHDSSLSKHCKTEPEFLPAPKGYSFYSVQV